MYYTVFNKFALKNINKEKHGTKKSISLLETLSYIIQFSLS